MSQATRRPASLNVGYCDRIPLFCPVPRVLITNGVKIVKLITQTHCHTHTQGNVSQSCKQLLSGVYLGHVKACGETVADSPSFQGHISHSYRACPSAEPDTHGASATHIEKATHKERATAGRCLPFPVSI